MAKPSDPAQAPSRDLTVLRRLFAMLRPYRGRFWLAVATLLAASGITLVYPQAARSAIDAGIGEASAETLNHVILLLVVAFIAHAGLVWLRHYTMSWLGERVVADLRGLVMDRVLRLPLAWFHERRSGELVGRLSADVAVIEGVVGSELSQALRNGVQLLGGLVLLFVIDWRLTLLMLAVVPPIVLASVWFGKRLRVMSKQVQDQLAEVSGQVQESIGAIQTVQAFVRESAEAAAYRRGIEESFLRMRGMFRWRSSFFAITMALGYLAVALIIWVGGHAMIDGRLSPGDLTSFFLYTFMIAGAIGEMASLWGQLQRAAGATERLFAIVDTAPDIADPPAPRALPAAGSPEARGEVRFTDVHFAYPGRADAPVLRGIDLHAAPGQVLAIVGPSGAGKSTLANLLFRFFDVGAGEVSLDGIDVRTLRLADLRSALALVAQEPVLFSGTLRANIGYARDDASDADIERAAKDAHAHGFITGFPDGYNTLIGERGVKLSGGQKQRIAIARALLANPRVLILDEATSNLDSESEAAVQAALATLMKGRTTIVIAHRLSTIRDADQIAVLEHGRIAERGRHAELAAAGGPYQRLIEHQLAPAAPAAS